MNSTKNKMSPVSIEPRTFGFVVLIFFLEDISPFRGATDTPASPGLDFW